MRTVIAVLYVARYYFPGTNVDMIPIVCLSLMVPTNLFLTREADGDGGSAKGCRGQSLWGDHGTVDDGPGVAVLRIPDGLAVSAAAKCGSE
jgi:hypothetical protein